MQRCRHKQAHMTVDAAALIPPALVFVPLDINGEHVRSAVEIGAVGDVEHRLGIYTERTGNQAAVEPDHRVGRNALKAQGEHLSLVVGRQKKRLAIPAVLRRAIAPPRSVFLLECCRIEIVMRQIYPLPQGVVIAFSRGSGGVAALCRVIGGDVILHADGENIPQVELPIKVHVAYFSLHKNPLLF